MNNKTPKTEIYPVKVTNPKGRTRWAWRLISPNGKDIAQSPGTYAYPKAAEDALKAARDAMRSKSAGQPVRIEK